MFKRVVPLKKEIIKKSIAAIPVIMLTTTLLACGGGNASKLDTSSIEIKKDGSVISTLIEDFSESYYSADELRDMVENEVNSFIVAKGEGAAELKSLNIDDGKAKLVLSFSNTDNFNDFSNETLIYETVTDAVLAGQLDVNTLVDKEGNPIAPDRAATLSSQHVILSKTTNIIVAPYKIAYFYGKSKPIDKYMADFSENAEGELACIVLDK